MGREDLLFSPAVPMTCLLGPHLSARSKGDEGSAPAAGELVGEPEVGHSGMASQNSVDPLPEDSRSLPMDDANGEDAFLPAEIEIVGEEVSHLPGAECMEIEHSIEATGNSGLTCLF